MTSSMRPQSWRIPGSRPPRKFARCGPLEQNPANSGEKKSVRFADSGLVGACAVLHHGARAEVEARPLRGLLLPPEHALRFESERAVYHVSARGPWARARAPAGIRLPGRTHH